MFRNALDFDAGPYGDMTYSIVSPCPLPQEMPHDHNLFLIDPLTGILVLSKSLTMADNNTAS